jgi:hypothetical protein
MDSNLEISTSTEQNSTMELQIQEEMATRIDLLVVFEAVIFCIYRNQLYLQFVEIFKVTL